MTNLLLTSAGLANKNITNQFLQIIGKPVSETRLVFVPAAARSEEELKYVCESKRELLDLGILETNIKTLNLDKPVSFDDIGGFDVLYVCGGNTFFLLKKVRETGFDKVIVEFVNRGGLYVGVSAGSILVCPGIEIAAPFDENDVNLVDLNGLGLVDVVVSPHYCEKERELVDSFKKISTHRIVPLTDDQALLVVDGETKIVE